MQVKIKLDIIYEDTKIRKVFPLKKTLLKQCIQHIIQKVGIPKKVYSIEVCLLVCTIKRISELNYQFLDSNKETNVLSFPSIDFSKKALNSCDLDAFCYLGDIAISYATCIKEAEKLNINTESRVLHLFSHAILHLLGFDHITNKQQDTMQKIEKHVIEQFHLNSKQIVDQAYEKEI